MFLIVEGWAAHIQASPSASGGWSLGAQNIWHLVFHFVEAFDRVVGLQDELPVKAGFTILLEERLQDVNNAGFPVDQCAGDIEGEKFEVRKRRHCKCIA